MPQMRFNHMELTLPTGSLDEQMRADIQGFYGDILGWQTMDIPLLGQMTYYLAPDDGQFILLAESEKPIQSPGYDHLGLLVDTWSDVDELLEQCEKFAASDSRMKIKKYDDLHQGPVRVRAFYVKYLLPIYFDIQSMKWDQGSEPSRKWSYA